MFAARLHLAPEIVLSSGEVQLSIKNRTRGLLTGSRRASLLAMLSMMDAFVEIRPAMLAEALPLRPVAFVASTVPPMGPESVCCTGTRFIKADNEAELSRKSPQPA
jgi:hypothetical protein